MQPIMWILFIFIICQRVIELKIAKRNEQWMKEKGGIEKGQTHYKWFIVLHTAFFLSILFEVIVRDQVNIEFNSYLFALFILTQLARVWCIQTLGKFWNTKIIILPNSPLVRKGPYKFVKHPNYIIVGLELFIIPWLFGAYYTAIIFPFLHVTLMAIRIPMENKALAEINIQE
ncbi:isoprenylcysteine carboxyl methyltransferase family protein [Oceanobacillus bengalensis]|uniref:Isoprenylcysteine carboxyl methyltransferase n=1 Tax=Oceanobacillus bengalensis TaxID=1435466 RepID=A0A494YUR8_9BACI|nr:isoprenylcysteine carboxylmethyltransferase family protein [Oceanobacillus bengalensis]RKQ13916.1 hypothetical protein D8M05_14615 [Oceanobacillus bengalensis]